MNRHVIALISSSYRNAIRLEENKRDQIAEHFKSSRKRAADIKIESLLQSVASLNVDIERQTNTIQSFKDQVREV